MNTIKKTYKYRTLRLFKNGDKPQIVEEGLTEEDAKNKVSNDLEQNSKMQRYLLVYQNM